MEKDLNFLQRLKQKLNPHAAMLNVLKSFLPQFAAQLAEMEKPENGLLKEGEDKIAYILTHRNGDLIVSICPLAYDKTAGRMTIGKPINTQPLEKMIENGGDSGSNPGN